MRTPSHFGGVRPPTDYWVDRPEMEARQRVESTGTNRPSGLNNTHHFCQGGCVLASLCGSRKTAGEPLILQMNTDRRIVLRVPWTCGGHGGGETPGPISNPEVKPSSADGTARETVWESRSPPQSTWERPRTSVRGLSAFPGVFFPRPRGPEEDR